MLFANNANTTLASSLTNSATSMSVTSASAFPSPTGSQYFYCTLADAATQQTIEIVKVTAVSGTTFTIVRGQDGTSGTAFNSGDVVSLRLVRASLNDFPKLDEVNTFSQTQTFSTAPITTSLTGYIYGNGSSAQTASTTIPTSALSGQVSVPNGGTGLSSLTTNYIPYGNGTGAFSSSSSFIFNGTNFAVGLTAPYNSTTDIGSFSKSYAGVSQVVIDNQTSTGTSGLSFSAYGGGWNLQVPGSTSFINPLIFKFNSTETVRFFASGGVSIGNTTDPGATNLSVTGKIFVNSTNNVYGSGEALSVTTGTGVYGTGFTGTNTGSIIGIWNKGTSSPRFIEFAQGSSGTTCGSISYNGTLTVYATTSDRRLKDNISTITPEQSAKFIDSLTPRSFNWKESGINDYGFIADEIQQIMPNSVIGTPDAVNEENKPVYQMIDSSSSEMIAMLVTEIQSLRARLKKANIA